jgi:hypothetical protein
MGCSNASHNAYYNKMKLCVTLLAFALAAQYRLDAFGNSVALLRASQRSAAVWMQLSSRDGEPDEPDETRVLIVVLFGLLACLTCLLGAHICLRLVRPTQSKFYQTRLVHLQRNYRSREYYKSLYPKLFETVADVAIRA